MRDISIRYAATHFIMKWATSMALSGCSVEERKALCVQFFFDNIVDHRTPWVLRKIDVKHADWTEPVLKQQADVLGFHPMYQLFLGQHKYFPTLIPSEDCEKLGVYIPHWPWILAQLCTLDNYSEWISSERLRFLLTSVVNSAPGCPFYTWVWTFKGPRSLSEYPWSMSRYDEWFSKTGLVLFF